MEWQTVWRQLQAFWIGFILQPILVWTTLDTWFSFALGGNEYCDREEKPSLQGKVAED